MTKGPRPQKLAAWVTMAALALATAALSQSGQISQVATPGVQKRMATMTGANTALSTLTDMMGGRAMFDKTRAKAARRTLMDATGDIPKVFRKPHSDPLSNAKPLVWSQWDDFKSHARSAQKAARALDIDSLPDLRQTLPRLLHACLSCHRIYRKPM